MVCNIILYLSNISSQFIGRIEKKNHVDLIEKKIMSILMKEEKYSIKGQTMLVLYLLPRTFIFFLCIYNSPIEIIFLKIGKVKFDQF